MSHISTEILFEKFEVIECLKKDVHTSVYIATHIFLQKKIILKTLNTQDLFDKTILERFKREAKILALLDHPNLIKVLDFGTYENFFYISFEYFESRNLRKIIQSEIMPEEIKIQLIIQLMKALNIAHQNNIIHRDIKPENILVNSRFELKIADFGLALAKDDTLLTHKSSIVGTPGYMSPEQIRGEKLSHQSDIFSAGIVAFELFTGRNPFVGKDISETVNNILSFEENKISDELYNVPAQAHSAITQMLKRNIHQRAKSANDILSLLGVTGEIFTPIEVKLDKKKRKTNGLVFSGILISAVILLFYFIKPVFEKGNDTLEDASTDSARSTLNSPGLLDSLKDSTITYKEENSKNLPGKLFVEVTQQTEVYVDNRKIDSTRIKDFIELTPGRHTLKLIHPDYPPYIKRIYIESDKIESINVNLPDIIGYLDCKIYPWGEIYINNEYKTISPTREPILLYPGTYTITIKNPQYGNVSKKIKIASGQTFEYQYNFENIGTEK